MSKSFRKILVLGSGALKIGEAGEFDYSGSQAIKALKEEGISTVLVNPNIATIQTSDHLADQIHFLPVDPVFVEKVIQKERPDGILLGFGGQTALNCGLALDEKCVLKTYGVEVLGTPIDAIRATEDRDLFAQKLSEIGVNVPRSAAARTVDEAVRLADQIGYPVMLRVAYALGGLGSGLCVDDAAVRERAHKALAHSPQVLIEEYLTGWKEVEYEVVRDRYDNCVTVCNMENLDPIGIHTGESIVVAPSQTLSNTEYHLLRSIAIKVVRHFGIVGECNIQYAFHPRSLEYRVIEVNARLSRSSALASKATGYPLAFVAAKLALGYSLTELTNSVTGVTKACFEPALDYITVKVPRWDLQKFNLASTRLGSGMKSVGEVMGIGRTFEEAFQKALRMLDIGVQGLTGNDQMQFADVEKELREPTHQRIFAIPVALKRGYSIDSIHQFCHIDKWFLRKIQNIVSIEDRLAQCRGEMCPPDLLLSAKQAGFSDRQIGRLLDLNEFRVRKERESLQIVPCVKQIDTLAGEYPAQTNYLYMTYNGTSDDIKRTSNRNSVIVLGSGPYRIGSSVEFDWCCVSAVHALDSLNYKTIVINCNPETVSTDFNECDSLYFEELSLERVLDIYEREEPLGVIVSMGGQVPNNLASKLQEAGAKVLGTAPAGIDTAENRHRFSKLLDDLGIAQAEWQALVSLEDARTFSNRVGYPVLVRPSFVLSGAAMGVATNDEVLERFLKRAADVSLEHPVVITKFLENAKELEIDAVAANGEIVAHAICEHVENAGVHSGDATLVLPPQRTYLETTRRIRKITEKIARALRIHGPFNIQFLAKANEVKVIECNVRASRSFPFVSKVLKVNFIELATKAMLGYPVPRMNGSAMSIDYVGVKAPHFSFTRLDGADPTLGVEMASTGEVACLGNDFEEAFLKALLSVGYRLPLKNVLLSTGPMKDKAAFVESARLLQQRDIRLYATRGTAEFLSAHGIESMMLHWPLEDGTPNVIDFMNRRQFDLVINIPKNYQEAELTNDYLIRRRAVDFGIPLITNIQLAQRFVEAVVQKSLDDLEIRSYSEYIARG